MPADPSLGHPPPGGWLTKARSFASAELPMLGPAVALTLMVLWTAHDGGYDQDTWYWGTLVLLGCLVLGAWTSRGRIASLPTAMLVAVAAFGLYVAWSYASITWAASPGDALSGSNRALLYLEVFTVLSLAPWTVARAAAMLMCFALAVGAVGLLLLMQMAEGHGGPLFSQGRLVSPTGYFNASAAVFTLGALLSSVLAARRGLPLVGRAALLMLACSDIQLAILGQSRGWLFTLPLVILATLLVTRDRWRAATLALLPLAGALAMLSRLLAVYRAHAGSTVSVPALVHAARTAGRTGLLVTLAILLASMFVVIGELRLAPMGVPRRTRRWLSALAIALVLLIAGAGITAATHGHPFRFASRQWNGFTHPPTATSAGTHFSAVGSGRYDFWRVALHAFLTHPLGGLGQDNFADYYLPRRRTNEEPAWTHSLEMRLLAHTGIVGMLLFATFLGAALAPALRGRGIPAGGLARSALVPAIVWLIHGSVDWFWEIPALSAPALGFLALSGSLAQQAAPNRVRRLAPRARPRSEHRPLSPALPARTASALGVLGVLGATIALGFPFLSVREVSTGSDLSARNPSLALGDLARAGVLNPLSADPGRLGGTIALENGLLIEAEQRFRQAIAREPGGWFAWLGDGLAASALGDESRARRDFVTAESIDSQQPAVRQALVRVHSTHPLTPAQALKLLVIVR
ncbi:MAG: O-antigen ligase family protein [Solirubrobacteraceae bacterium]